jgi:hypothetical protein
MAPKKKDERQPVIRYAPIGPLKVYEVQEHELDSLASGSDSSIWLNFAIALLFSGVSFLFTLAGTKIESDRVFLAIVSYTTISLIAGLICLIVWWLKYRSSKNLIAEIKNRMVLSQTLTDSGKGNDRFTVQKMDEPPSS